MIKWRIKWRLCGYAAFVLFGLPKVATAADSTALDPPIVSALPFVGMLLSIALVPLFYGRFWERNRNKGLIAAVWSAPVVIYLLSRGATGANALGHELSEYVSFIILLGSLYTVSGGIVLRGDIEARPLTNTLFLATGAIFANVIGTTGASMLLIRPLLQVNSERRNTRHLPVFFIFVVSNFGGLLLPLGDPPLFLGFLQGVKFFWTTSLWPQWLVANGLVLAIFFVWDSIAYRRESQEAIRADVTHIEPLRVRGLVNVLFLAGILVGVAFQSAEVAGGCRGVLGRLFNCPDLTLHRPWGEIVMLTMAALSLLATPKELRRANAFTWGAITEVAVLFAGIFVTMVPALVWLERNGPTLGITEPWQFFWLSGGLSSFLDNAPTYLTFGTLAAGPHDFAWLMEHKPLILAAVSTGSVFMGANSYIGNGPNFMVKAIADEAGLRTPSFFGYMAYSTGILIPVFLLITWLFF